MKLGNDYIIRHSSFVVMHITILQVVRMVIVNGLNTLKNIIHYIIQITFQFEWTKVYIGKETLDLTTYSLPVFAQHNFMHSQQEHENLEFSS